MRNQFGCITYQFRRISKNGNRCQDTLINARFAPRHYILFVILCKITFMNNIINKYLDDTSLFHHDLFITIFIYKNERVCTDPRAVPKSREPGNYPALNDDITRLFWYSHSTSCQRRNPAPTSTFLMCSGISILFISGRQSCDPHI